MRRIAAITVILVICLVLVPLMLNPVLLHANVRVANALIGQSFMVINKMKSVYFSVMVKTRAPRIAFVENNSIWVV